MEQQLFKTICFNYRFLHFISTSLHIFDVLPFLSYPPPYSVCHWVLREAYAEENNQGRARKWTIEDWLLSWTNVTSNDDLIVSSASNGARVSS